MTGFRLKSTLPDELVDMSNPQGLNIFAEMAADGLSNFQKNDANFVRGHNGPTPRILLSWPAFVVVVLGLRLGLGIFLFNSKQMSSQWRPQPINDKWIASSQKQARTIPGQGISI